MLAAIAQARRDRRGNTAIIFALAMPIVVGGAGLAVETSFDYVSHSRLQSAADAAAYAAAIEKMGGGNAAVLTAAASQQATDNGWTASGGTITVNSPPTSGPKAGAQNAVEVRMTQSAPRFFTAYFSSTPLTVGARAVAVSITAANACILALDRTASQTVQVQGSSSLTLTGCDVMSDSIASDALSVWGSGHLTADCAVSVGGVQNKGGMTLTSCPSAITQAPPAGDPFAGLPAPPKGTTQSVPAGGGPTTLSPGYYPSGMNLKGTVTLSPGTYYVGGAFKINANAVISGSGVTIFMAAGSQVSMQGNANVVLAAPTSGTYSGVLFYGDRTAASGSNVFDGDASSHLTGDIYFPTQEVSYRGNFTGVNGCTHIVAGTVQWIGNATISVGCPGQRNIPARQAVKLVE